jgi:hypothetical protein
MRIVQVDIRCSQKPLLPVKSSAGLDPQHDIVETVQRIGHDVIYVIENAISPAGSILTTAAFPPDPEFVE